MPEPVLPEPAQRLLAPVRDSRERWELMFKALNGGVPPLTAAANFALALCLEYAPELDDHAAQDGQVPVFNRPLVMLLSLALYAGLAADRCKDINKMRLSTARQVMEVDAAAGQIATWRPSAHPYQHPDACPTEECGTAPANDAADLARILSNTQQWITLRGEASGPRRSVRVCRRPYRHAVRPGPQPPNPPGMAGQARKTGDRRRRRRPTRSTVTTTPSLQ